MRYLRKNLTSIDQFSDKQKARAILIEQLVAKLYSAIESEYMTNQAELAMYALDNFMMRADESLRKDEEIERDGSG